MWRRSLFQRIVCFASTLVLAAGVVAAPIQVQDAIIPSTLSTHPGNGFLPFPTGSSHPASKAAPTSAHRIVKAISTKQESEPEQECIDAPTPRLAISPRAREGFKPDAEPMRSAFVRATRPLRC